MAQRRAQISLRDVDLIRRGDDASLAHPDHLRRFIKHQIRIVRDVSRAAASLGGQVERTSNGGAGPRGRGQITDRALETRIEGNTLTRWGIAVHGRPTYDERSSNARVVEALRRISAFDPQHLPT